MDALSNEHPILTRRHVDDGANLVPIGLRKHVNVPVTQHV